MFEAAELSPTAMVMVMVMVTQTHLFGGVGAANRDPPFARAVPHVWTRGHPMPLPHSGNTSLITSMTRIRVATIGTL